MTKKLRNHGCNNKNIIKCPQQTKMTETKGSCADEVTKGSLLSYAISGSDLASFPNSFQHKHEHRTCVCKTVGNFESSRGLQIGFFHASH
jgi:hypothetical protein